jgi:hypothetical protein
MDPSKIFLLMLLVVKMVHVGRQKRLEPNDVFIMIVVLYMFVQRCRSTHEFNAIPGASSNIDETAWVNLHAILHELYNNDTLTIPGNLVVQGNLNVDGGQTRTSSLWVNDVHVKDSNTPDAANNWNDDVPRPWIRFHDDVHVGWGARLNAENIGAYNINLASDIHPSDSKYWIRFQDDVHVGWYKNLDVSGHTRLEGGLKLPGIKAHGEDSNGPLRVEDEDNDSWVYENGGDDILKLSDKSSGGGGGTGWNGSGVGGGFGR